MENYRIFFVREAERITGCVVITWCTGAGKKNMENNRSFRYRAEDMKSLGNTLPGHGSPVLWKSPEGRWMRHPGMRTVQGM